MEVEYFKLLVFSITVFYSLFAEASSAAPPETWYGKILKRISALERKDMELEGIHRNYMKLKTEVVGMRNSQQHMIHLIQTDKVQEEQKAQAVGEKAKYVLGETKRLADAMLSVGDLENHMNKVLKIHDADQRKHKLNVSALSQTVKNDGAGLKSMAHDIAILQEEVKNAGLKTKKLEEKLFELSANAMFKANKFDETIRPILKEFRNSQGTLGEAFRMTTKKVLKLEPLIPALERKFDQKVATVEEIGKQETNLNKQVVYLNNRLDEDKREIMDFLAPLAKDNVEMRDMAAALGKEIADVKKQAYSIDADILIEQKAKNVLNKEVSQLRSSRQIMLDKTLHVGKGIGHVRELLHQKATQGPDTRMMSNLLVRQMAVLKNLKNLRSTQGNIQNSMNAYKASLLKTHRLLLDRDQRRIREEVDLGQLKAKLLKVYLKIKNMADRIPLTVMTAIVDHQKRNLERVHHARDDQANMRKTLDNWAPKVFGLRANMKQSLLQEKADKAVLDSLSVRVARLNNRFNKLSKTPPGAVGALSRLGDLLETERALTGVTNAYNAHLMSPIDQYRMAHMWQTQQAARNVVHNVGAIMGKKKPPENKKKKRQ